MSFLLTNRASSVIGRLYASAKGVFSSIVWLPCLVGFLCPASLVGRWTIRQNKRRYSMSSFPNTNPIAAAYPTICLLSPVFPLKDTGMAVGSALVVDKAEAPGWDPRP